MSFTAIVTMSTLFLVLIPAAIAKTRQAYLDRTTVELWAICAALVFLALAPVVILSATRWFPGLLTKRTGQLGGTLSSLIGCVTLQLFYLAYIAKYLRWHRVRLEIFIFIAVVGATVYLLKVAVPGDHYLQPTIETLTQQPAAPFYWVIASTYMTYTWGTQLYWTARYLRKFRNPVFRAAALITAVGAAILVIALTFRNVFIIDIAWLGGRLGSAAMYRPDILAPSVPVATAILVIGLTIPVLATQVVRLRQWLHTYRVFRQLAPLAQAITWAFPELVRPERPGGRTGSSRRAALVRGPSACRMAMQLRLTQCRDGYTRLGPYLAGSGREENSRAGALAKALRASTPDHVQQQHDDDVRHLCKLSRALGRGQPLPLS
jgi:hypothetical protein